MPLCVEGAGPERPAEQPPGCLVCDGPAADRYVERLRAALAAARLNAHFPPSRPLAAHHGFLGPAGSEGIYPALHLSPLNGLPTAREILRVKIDRELAPVFLAEAAERPAPPTGTKLQRRIAYYSRLVQTAIMPADRMQIDLRHQRPAEGLAALRMTIDRFDLAGNQFVRYTVLFAQRDRFWHRPHVSLDDADLAVPTTAFRRTASRLTSHEAEVAFLLLSEVEGIEVEDVRRCRMGPMLLPGAAVGDALEALLDPGRGPCAERGVPPWILCFPEDRAGIEVAEHLGRDPLARLMRDAVGEEARSLLDAKVAEHGYRVVKSRKFVCPAPLREPLAALCRELGAPSIVHAV